MSETNKPIVEKEIFKEIRRHCIDSNLPPSNVVNLGGNLIYQAIQGDEENQDKFHKQLVDFINPWIDKLNP